MNDRLPYEEQLTQQLNDLPLPDENMAWADMQRRLEEDDDDGIIVWWRRGCALWGLLFVMLLATGWWLVTSEKWFSDKKTIQKTLPKEETDSFNKTRSKVTIIKLPKTDSNDQQERGLKGEARPTVTDRHATPATIKSNKVNSENDEAVKLKTTANDRIGITEKTNTLTEKRIAVDKKKKNKLPPDGRARANNHVTPGVTKTSIEQNQKTDTAVLSNTDNPVTNFIYDSLPVNLSKQVITTDLVTSTPANDSIKKKTMTVDTALTKPTYKKVSTKKNTFFFSTGLVLQQQLPVGGQKATPYNSLGRKGTLLDYIPSVYVRLNRTNKWFIQSEFKYGAPQYTKEFVYGQITVLDTAGTNNFTNTTSLKLKKTYYHQLTLTFNYYVLPNWSVGTGIVWNKFSSAISEWEVTQRDNQTLVDTVLSKEIIKSTKDSVSSLFSKNYLQAAFETQYQWKRFSFGARYAFGLQPYIKFSLDSGILQQEKNSSLQIFFRYELWRSKAKK